MLLVRYLPFEGAVARWFLSCRPLSVPVDGLPDPLAVRGDLTSAEGVSVFATVQDDRSLELVNHLCPLTGQRPDQAERLHRRAAQGADLRGIASLLEDSADELSPGGKSGVG
jgi:hypothetical protein